jgi:hypothetical protein
MSYANNAAIPRTPPRPTRFQSSPAASSSACSAIAPIPFPSLDAAYDESSAPRISPEHAAANASLTELLMLQKSVSHDSTAEDSCNLTLLFSQADSSSPPQPAFAPPASLSPPPASLSPPAFAGFLPTAPAFSAAALAFGDKMAFAGAFPPSAPPATPAARVAQLVSAAEQVASCRKNKTFAAVLAGTDISADEFAKFYHENGYARRADMPILLFDLNSTLVFRPKAHEVAGPKGTMRLSGRREILVRPHIHLLRVLLERYRIGVFTSAESHNASAICAAVESKVGGAIFDRNLIFSRKDTQVYTAEERAALGLDSFKRKKVLGDLFAPEHLGKVVLIDDHPERAVLTGARAIPISSWYDETPNDGALLELVSFLMAPAAPVAPPPTLAPSAFAGRGSAGGWGSGFGSGSGAGSHAPGHSSSGQRSYYRGGEHKSARGSGGGAYPTTPPRSVQPRWD